MLEVLIVIAVECHSSFQSVGHLERIESVSHSSVYSKSLKLMLFVDEAQAVAIGESGSTGYVERVVPNLLDVTDKLALGFWGIGREDIGLTSVEEICGVSAVEGFLEIGGEFVSHSSI